MMIDQETAEHIATAIRDSLIDDINKLNIQVSNIIEIYKVNGLKNNYPLEVYQNLRRVEEINQQISTSVIEKTSTMIRL